MGRAALAVFVGLIALACGDRPPPPEPAPAAHQVVFDTTHIVVRETLHTVVQDTVRTVFTDTQRSVTLDTIRTVLLREETIPSSGAAVDSVKAAEVTQAEKARGEIRSGKLTVASLAYVTRGIPPLRTVPASRIDSVCLSLLSTLSGVHADRIQKVRWSEMMAPAGHPHAGGAFVSVWSRSDELTVVRLDSTGRVMPEDL